MKHEGRSDDGQTYKSEIKLVIVLIKLELRQQDIRTEYETY